MQIVTVDFETHTILSRPEYPPAPVSVAILWPDGREEFLAWGHPAGNNVTESQACRILEDIWFAAIQDSSVSLLFHNAKFDLAVAEEQLLLPPLPWDGVHDTMFLAFLADPHARELGLKPLAEDWLDWPPDEKDAVAEWVWGKRKELVATYGGKITRAKSGPNSAGAWLSRCPADIVEPYAVGDVRRTRALFDHLMPLIERWGMEQAYDRERRVMPIFMENERRGLRADQTLLDHDVNMYHDHMAKVEHWLRRRLGVDDLNMDADEQVAEALESAGIVEPVNWVRTKTGRRSVSKDNLTPSMFTDPQVAAAMGYRNRLQTCLSTFMEPWLEQARRTGGRLHTTWNQVRSELGTRTGRPSTSRPNILNIPKAWTGRNDGYEHPTHIAGIAELPLVRRYVLPEEGHVWLHRDFSNQELRVFAEYEQGALYQAYMDDPTLDPHGWVRDELARLLGIELDRGTVKTLNFQAIYGGGVNAAATKLQCSMAAAREYKAFHDKALPGRKLVNEEIQRLVRRGEPIITLGGRVYFCERPRFVGGKRQTFGYKLINYKCQGSAADITKEVLANWYAGRGDSIFCSTVYDEINTSAPRDHAAKHMQFLRQSMEKVDMISVPMLTEGRAGPRWGELDAWEEQE